VRYILCVTLCLMTTSVYAQQTRSMPKLPPNKVPAKKAAEPEQKKKVEPGKVKDTHSTKDVHKGKQDFNPQSVKPASGKHKTKKGTHYKKGMHGKKGTFKL
jgi:hypothetical protein